MRRDTARESGEISSLLMLLMKHRNYVLFRVGTWDVCRAPYLGKLGSHSTLIIRRRGKVKVRSKGKYVVQASGKRTENEGKYKCCSG